MCGTLQPRGDLSGKGVFRERTVQKHPSAMSPAWLGIGNGPQAPCPADVLAARKCTSGITGLTGAPPAEDGRVPFLVTEAPPMRHVA